MKTTQPLVVLLACPIFVNFVQAIPGVESAPASQPRDYKPGVRISWQPRAVELRGKVVLREGYLEFFACSGDTKGHESIVSIVAEPLDVFEALGLIGLVPGRPARFDPATGVEHAPSGDTVELVVRWSDGNELREVAAHEWMTDLATRRPAAAGRWIFTGSIRFRDGAFGASLDGAIASTVGFPTALLTFVSNPTANSTGSAPASQPGSQSPLPAADTPAGGVYSNRPTDPQLAADPRRVPPVGTTVTLVIRPAPPSSATSR